MGFRRQRPGSGSETLKQRWGEMDKGEIEAGDEECGPCS